MLILRGHAAAWIRSWRPTQTSPAFHGEGGKLLIKGLLQCPNIDE